MAAARSAEARVPAGAAQPGDRGGRRDGRGNLLAAVSALADRAAPGRRFGRGSLPFILLISEWLVTNLFDIPLLIHLSFSDFYLFL